MITDLEQGDVAETISQFFTRSRSVGRILYHIDCSDVDPDSFGSVDLDPDSRGIKYRAFQL